MSQPAVGRSDSSSKRKEMEAKQDKLRQDIDFTEHLFEVDKFYKFYFPDLTLDGGLTDAQVLHQRQIKGPNELPKPPETAWWIKFLLQFTNFFAMLLLGGGTLCFIGYALDQSDASNLYLGVVLYVVVLITATFSYYQEAKSEKIMEGFKDMIPASCTVVRNGGKLEKVNPTELVPGDVVELNAGDQVPADLRVMFANECKVDNASLTGESEPVDRTSDIPPKALEAPMEATNIVFYTTMVVSGSMRGVVIGTGERTAMGKIAGLTTETENVETPINKEITKFVHLISAVAIVLGVTFFIIGIVQNPDKIIKNVVFMIGIIVANVPEGLLATVTVSLSLTAQRMSTKNVLVKKLEAIETLGSTTVICSDKTGTLTQNRMTIVHAWYSQQIFDAPAAKNNPHYQTVMSNTDSRDYPLYKKDDATFKKLQMVAALCNNAKFADVDALVKDHPLKPESFEALMNDERFNLLMEAKTGGDASESGILKFLQPIEDVEQYRARYPKQFEIKFNSTNKWQLSVHRQPDTESMLCVLKGAPERVLTKCKWMLINGEKVEVTPEIEANYTTSYETIGGFGERVLGFAYKDLEAEYSKDFAFEHKNSIPNFPADDLTFVGLLSLIDPPREGVPEAVEKCKRARVKVFMVTGDHPITAEAIAKQIGIIDQKEKDAGHARVIKGDDIRSWMEPIEQAMENGVADSEMASIKAGVKVHWDAALKCKQLVWARVSPNQKLLIVENNQLRGEVVAVTGDGVNDAPALKKGDIGIAMGIAGKEVTKAAADMVLLDDNFASIVNGVEEGRLIFDNLKKSICYTLTSNIPEIGPFLLYITVNLPLPLSTVLILCVDLGTDMVPAISMAYEEKESDIMDRPPRNSATDRLVNSKLITFAYLQIGVMQALAGFFTYMVVLNDYGYPPWILPMKGLDWDEYQLMCTLDGQGKPDKCGYGCKTPDYEKMFGKDYGHDKEFCKGGCKIPFNVAYGSLEAASVDPFVEHTASGFRGFDLTDDAFTCQRNCGWWNEIKGKANLAEFYGVSTAEAIQFEYYCAKQPAGQVFGFENREKVSSQAEAPKGAYYWWDGKVQFYPNVKYQNSALEYAQTSYFISIIVVQWADLLIAKTRKLSLFEQGMENGFMNFGLCFETVLGMLLLYVPPLNLVFGTRPIAPLHWFPGVPWSILIFLYDETRKFLMRAGGPTGVWLEKFTYW